ncbi:hypothetical protein HG531_008957 [Fusarium graminearum]|nr:hypothetical protein HG531_008957 [Fusarium graminearum]
MRVAVPSASSEAGTAGKSLKKLHLSLESFLIETLHELAESWKLVLRNPDVIDQLVGRGAKVDSLLDIAGSLGSETLLVAADVGDVLLADEGVAAVGVGLGRVLGDHLCLKGKLEEALCLGEELVDVLGRDAVVDELDTTALLEETEEGITEVFLLVRRSEEQGHVEGIYVEGSHVVVLWVVLEV